ncbi:hypothetical protein TEPIDINF_001758 [Tepidibacillus infernus]|uniref:LysM domain-containing protein n=1 Tax=Tepidibacillus decaturensis TaxID=1413211 RepID=A0A135L5X0_9BACI|nr:hypothetical protein [Tepidibacillus decaturensis]KXG44243.1 hypothetical protein U473_09680 [Tepidibacillus decaturensis]
MKKLIPITLGIALLATAGSVFAKTTGTEEVLSAKSSSVVQSYYDHGWHGKSTPFQNDELLSLLKINAETLAQELKAGKSLANIASEKGVSEQKVIDLLVKQHEERIDQAVKSGKMTKEQADQIKSTLQDRVKASVEQTGGFKRGFYKGKAFHKGNLDDVATTLGMSQEELLSELKAGKSIAEIAKEKGIDKQKVIDSLLEKEKERITNWIDQPWKITKDNKQN